MNAFERLTPLLSRAGLTDIEADYLIAQFLDEESEHYVECKHLFE